MEIDIEKILCPESDKLIIVDELATAIIMDAELDEIEISYTCTDCAEINTKDYEYIALTRNNLIRILELMDEANDYYESETDLDL